MVHIKNALIILLFSVSIMGIDSCTKDHASTINTLSPDDNCWNLFARDSNYRKGKWVQILDSVTLKYENPDTIWFISDSLMGWGNSYNFSKYLYTHMYFDRCNNFVCQSWDSTEQARGKWYYRWEYLNYEKNTVSIIFNNGLWYDTVSYKKIQ